jgi:hypothetical protein
MHALSIKFSDIELPPKDGLLEKALAEFDFKLSTFSGALNSAQKSLRKLVSDNLFVQPESIEFSPSNSNSLSDIQASCINHETEAKGDKAQAKNADNSIGTVGAMSLKLENVESHRKISKTENTDIQHEQTCKLTAPETGFDDEELLATLDEEIAKKIRILRRMSSGKKSVRELLEKHKLNTSSETGETRRSFWRK